MESLHHLALGWRKSRSLSTEKIFQLDPTSHFPTMQLFVLRTALETVCVSMENVFATKGSEDRIVPKKNAFLRIAVDMAHVQTETATATVDGTESDAITPNVQTSLVPRMVNALDPINAR